MCGRYTLSAGHEALARAFLAEFPEDLKASWKARYNIAPGGGIVAIHEDRDKGGRRAEVFHWGLVPRWAKDPDIGYKMINARAETIAGKPAYRDAFRYRRCLIPASGFYEWDRRTSPRQPYYFHPREADFMAMAGVWEYWLHPCGSEIVSAAVITTTADSTVAPVHHRMPVILPKEAWGAWLDTRRVKPEMEPFLEARVPDSFLGMHPVSREVNKARAEGPELVEPIDERDTGAGQMDLFGE